MRFLFFFVLSVSDQILFHFIAACVVFYQTERNSGFCFSFIMNMNSFKFIITKLNIILKK